MEVVISNGTCTFAQVCNGKGFVSNGGAFMKLAIEVQYEGFLYNAVNLTSGHIRRFASEDKVEPRDFKVTDKAT